MGHSSVATTFDLYGKLLDRSEAEAVGKLDAYLSVGPTAAVSSGSERSGGGSGHRGRGPPPEALKPSQSRSWTGIGVYEAAKESNLPSGGLLRPAGFEDEWLRTWKGRRAGVSSLGVRVRDGLCDGRAASRIRGSASNPHPSLVRSAYHGIPACGRGRASSRRHPSLRLARRPCRVVAPIRSTGVTGLRRRPPTASGTRPAGQGVRRRREGRTESENHLRAEIRSARASYCCRPLLVHPDPPGHFVPVAYQAVGEPPPKLAFSGVPPL